MRGLLRADPKTRETMYFVSVGSVWTSRKLELGVIAVSGLCMTGWLEGRFHSPFDEPIIPFGSGVMFHRRSSKDQGRAHQFGTKALPGTFIGYALNAGESWSGDLLIVDTEDLQTTPQSETHVKKKQMKRSGHSKMGTMRFSSLAERAKCCKTDHHYPPLCTEQAATSGKNSEKHL